tara:strand:+ start:2986 stop:3924 length:939 start_codon:yes stop_codon:yes gene_type:complete
MGIKYLNYYLQQNCKQGIQKINLYELSHKKIVVDTSIYMYRFMGENALLENFYLMISIFRKYDIIPLFVFDGKPPKEKEDLLIQRKIDKKNAEEKYLQLEEKYKNETNEDEKEKIQEYMEKLKKNFIRITFKDIENVKFLIQSYGVSYIEAPGEADKLCAKLVMKKKAYACLSEDMDMFVYGCNRVLRYLSLLKSNAILYDLSNILKELQIDFQEFRNICILSGTDYNLDNKFNVIQLFKYFKKFKQEKADNFYEWMKIKYNINECKINEITQMFHIDNNYKENDKIKFLNGPIHHINLQKVMKKENFIFVF